MDLSLSAATTSVIGETSNIVIPSKRDLFLSTYQPHQSWSFPDSVIYYISKNPTSSKIYKKLIQSCKYFFIKNSILVVSSLSVNNEWKTIFNEKKIDFKNISSKIWVTDCIGCCVKAENVDHQYFDNSILPKIYQSDIEVLILWSQNISYNDLVFLASKCKETSLWHVRVLNKNGSDVAVEKIVETFPVLKKFFFYIDGNIDATEIITSKTAKNLIENPHFSKLQIFRLVNIPECFDIDTFFSYIKKNRRTIVYLTFVKNLSQQYQNRLQAIINEIIQAKKHFHRRPYIGFPGSDPVSNQKLWDIWG